MPRRFRLGLTAVALALPFASAAAQGPSFPWRPGDAPPLVAGLRIGGSRASIDSALGRPEAVQDMGGGVQALDYGRIRGVSVTYAPLDGVAIIVIYTRQAADIGGVRVGDTLDGVAARWGSPSQLDGTVAMYLVGHWVVVLYLDAAGHEVQMLAIGRVANSNEP